MWRSFFTEKKWLLWSWGGFSFIILSLLAQTYIDVKINEWYKGFYDLLQKAPERELSEFYDGIKLFMKLAIPYVIIYTIWLKRMTSLNIVIGGAAGAIPPIIGWATVVPEISFLPVMMFLIIFFWTPPHFWALSVYRFNDYEKVKVPMLPNVKSISDTKNQIVYYTILLVILSYTPLYSNLIGYIYLFIASALNFVLIRSAFKLKKSVEVKDQPNAEGLRFFALTIFYLFSLFSALLIDNLILL